MGVISRRVLPACGSLCICFPELRARSRQPVKRYKKLLSDVFPKSQDEPPNDRKIGKLIEYASKNPLRIPKIATGLEQRGYRELRHEHYGTVRVVMRTFNRLLASCRDQMPLFASSLLNIIRVLLEQGRQDSMRILGCLSVVDFVDNQTDATHMRNLDSLVPKLCAFCREAGEERRRTSVRAAGLQALSTMITFMGKYSYMPVEFEEIIAVILDNYEAPSLDQETGTQDRTEANKWVKEVLKVEGRGPVATMRGALTKFHSNKYSSYLKDSSSLTRLETQTPKVWAQICVQNMGRLAKEATTVRRILEPMFKYFDNGTHWAPEKGLALTVLRDMQHAMEKSGCEQVFLPVLVRHLDHKSVTDNLPMKTDIIEVIGNLAHQSKARATVADVGAMSDLVRHLRNSIRLSLELSKSPQTLAGNSRLNAVLHATTEDCLIELAKRLNDAAPLFDMMATTLGKLSPNPLVARTTVEAVSVLAQAVAYVADHSYAEQIFPEALFQELIQAMIHPDVETRIKAHDVFVFLLAPLNSQRNEGSSPCQDRSDISVTSRTNSAFASAAALFEKLRSEKYGIAERDNRQGRRSRSGRVDHIRESLEGVELKEVGASRHRESYVNVSRLHGFKLSKERSMEISMERIAHAKSPPNDLRDMEMKAVRLSGHQAALLLSTLWLSTLLPDNVPASYEAIAHTYILTLLFSRAKTSSHKTVIRAFQLSLSLRSLVLDLEYSAVQLPPSRRRSIFTLSTAMLVFAGRAYGSSQLVAAARASLTSTAKDPYLELVDDVRLKVVHSPAGYVNVKDYGTAADDRDALNSLSSISLSQEHTPEALAALIVGTSTVLEPEDFAVVDQMLQPFSAGEGYELGPKLNLETPLSCGSPLESLNSLSFDKVTPDKGTSIEDEGGDQHGGDLPKLLAYFPVPSLAPQAMGVSQLLEAALVTAGQVASSVSPSGTPLSYSAMASRCENFAVGTRKKLSTVLRMDVEPSSLLLTYPETPAKTPAQVSVQPHLNPNHNIEESMLRSPNLIDFTTPKKVPWSSALLTFTPSEPWQVFRLPPASPYDNFLKAVGC